MIKIIAVGKIKEQYIKDGIDFYIKNAKNEITVIEIQDLPIPNNASPKDEQKIKNLEGEKIIAKIADNEYVVALNIVSKKATTSEIKHIIKSNKNVTFIIGGSLGLSKEVLNKCDKEISFSNMTFTHQIARLFICEQVCISD